MAFLRAASTIPTYPVKVFDFGKFTADISQIFGFGPAKRIEVSISQQKMRIYEDNKLVKEFSVSTGAEGTPTPKGSFKVYDKIFVVHSNISGCYLPFWVGFTTSGLYGFHEIPFCAGQAVGLNKIGQQASLGCVRLGISDAKTFYDWVDVGTQATIIN